MLYHAKVSRDGRHWNAIFLDAPGCATFAASRAKVLLAAKEALEGWLEAHLVDGRAPSPFARHREVRLPGVGENARHASRKQDARPQMLGASLAAHDKCAKSFARALESKRCGNGA